MSVNMHDIEPHFRWRDQYIAAEDHLSPFYGRQYDEFRFTNKIYNYFIHPQWDAIGSPTLYIKVLFCDYERRYAILEFIGEWNDAIHNDIMILKREVIDSMQESGITKFILICENVLNFHGDEDCYYEEWQEEACEEGGWICLLNTLKHVEEELEGTGLQHYLAFGEPFNDVNWRPQKPLLLFNAIDSLMDGTTKGIWH